ncbi:MAG: MBOAT family protein [Desulfuromonas sp.]|nr:MBOAT family protein [Desulfuromonas sp.]
MVFNSLEYFLFLPAIWLVHYFLGQRFRWLFLLVASLIFYVSLKVPYLLGVITLVTITTYGFGLWIHRVEQLQQKKLLLWGGIATNVLILVAMKYVPFLTENLNVLLSLFDSPIKAPHAQLLVAIGVSYYVFQAISYLSDIYLEIEEPETHFGYFSLYLAFFPKLLQGPIERARDLLPQLKQKYEFNYDNMRFGLLLFTWGLFKKVVLADRLGLYVDAVYNDVHAYQGLPLLLATYAYAFQIYFDFSGYTDMALGTARLFNVKLTDNFNSPYLATSVADFWRRWHITFSRWILDYIFKPLQMSWRNWKNWGTAAALVVTFFVSGLWHGASWGFVIWGLLHGTYMACSVFYRPFQKKIHKAMSLEKTKVLKIWQIFVTFNLVCLAWVFFRAFGGWQALYVLKNIPEMHHNYVALIDNGWADFIRNNIMFGLDKRNIITLAACLICYAIIISKKSYDLLNKPTYIRWTAYYLLIFSIIFLQVSSKKYIYFQF